MDRFWRDIARRACWSKTFESPNDKTNWCDNQFGNFDPRKRLTMFPICSRGGARTRSRCVIGLAPHVLRLRPVKYFPWKADAMLWNERSLVEYHFLYGAKRRKAVARLGFPEHDESHDGEWVCSFQIEGVKGSTVRRARGMDGLQALTIASMAIRGSLDRLRAIESAGEPYEVVFPRYLPFCYGLEFHRQLCAMVDKSVKQKTRQIARRRSRRSSSS